MIPEIDKKVDKNPKIKKTLILFSLTRNPQSVIITRVECP